jgi:hypothetical protein
MFASCFRQPDSQGLVYPPNSGSAMHSPRSHDIAWNSRLGARRPRNIVAFAPKCSRPAGSFFMFSFIWPQRFSSQSGRSIAIQ